MLQQLRGEASQGIAVAGAGRFSGPIRVWIALKVTPGNFQRAAFEVDHVAVLAVAGEASARADYRPARDGVPAATRVSAGVAAILTSTSLTGWSVQARVT